MNIICCSLIDVSVIKNDSMCENINLYTLKHIERGYGFYNEFGYVYEPTQNGKSISYKEMPDDELTFNDVASSIEKSNTYLKFINKIRMALISDENIKHETIAKNPFDNNDMSSRSNSALPKSNDATFRDNNTSFRANSALPEFNDTPSKYEHRLPIYDTLSFKYSCISRITQIDKTITYSKLASEILLFCREKKSYTGILQKLKSIDLIVIKDYVSDIISAILNYVVNKKARLYYKFYDPTNNSRTVLLNKDDDDKRRFALKPMDKKYEFTITKPLASANSGNGVSKFDYMISIE